jgi:hypothetical protein
MRPSGGGSRILIATTVTTNQLKNTSSAHGEGAVPTARSKGTNFLLPTPELTLGSGHAKGVCGEMGLLTRHPMAIQVKVIG